MLEDDDPDGLSLEEALKKYSPPAQYAEVQHLKELMDDAAEYNQVRYARLKLRWRQIREPLEAAFRQELESGKFILCGSVRDGDFNFWGIQETSWNAIDPRWLRGAVIEYEFNTVRYDLSHYEDVRVSGVTPAAQSCEAPDRAFRQEANYRRVWLNGQYYQLGEKQAKVVKVLHQAQANNEGGWCEGKLLLAAAGSDSMRLNDLFKRKPGLIESDGRGLYRLRRET
jgi:hypothetical protein